LGNHATINTKDSNSVQSTDASTTRIMQIMIQVIYKNSQVKTLVPLYQVKKKKHVTLIHVS